MFCVYSFFTNDHLNYKTLSILAILKRSHAAREVGEDGHNAISIG